MAGSKVRGPLRVGFIVVTVVCLLGACTSAHHDGTFTGRLVAEGGPVLTPPRPLPGTVHITGEGRTRIVTVGADGRFSVDLPSGTYTITGYSPMYNSGRVACRARGPVTLQGGASRTVLIVCQEM